MRLVLRPAPARDGLAGMDSALVQMARDAAAMAAADAPDDEEEGELATLPTEFDGLRGWETDWQRMLTRVQKEMILAANWGRYVDHLQGGDWGRAGLVHLGCASLVASGVLQVGVQLQHNQRDPNHYANSLLHSARLVAHEVTHSAQMALRLADSSPADLKEFVEKLQQLGRADKAVDHAFKLPSRLEKLYSILEGFGVSVPTIDRQYVAQMRGWAVGLAAKCGALHEGIKGPSPGYAKQAVAVGAGLRASIRAVLHDGRARGLTNPESVAERMQVLAEKLTQKLEAIDAHEAPIVREWLATLQQDTTIVELSELAASELRVTSGAWELLSSWRRLVTSYLEMPLVKLQIRSEGLEAELRRYESAAAALYQHSRENIERAKADDARHPMPDSARPDESEAAGVAAGAAAGARVDSVSVAEPLLGGLVSGNVNVIVLSAIAEIAQWRDALPLVLRLIHPEMHAVQWQKVLAFAPPTKVTAPTAPDASKLADAERPPSPSAAPPEIAPEIAKGASKEKKALKLGSIWEERDAYAVAIETVLNETLANQKAMQLKAEKKAKKAAKQAEREKGSKSPARAR